MKQDKILCIIFTFIGLYLIGNSIFLYTLNMTIASISAIGLLIFALIFFFFAFKFYKLSKKEVKIIENNNINFENVETTNNDEQELDQVNLSESYPINEKENLERDETDEIVATNQIEEVEDNNITKKEMIEKELSELRKQQLLNKVKFMKIIFDENAQKTAMNKFFAIDIETTGLDKNKDSIIEIGAVMFELGKPVKVFNSLINPMKEIPEEATQIHHINNDMVKDAPGEKEVLEHLIVFLNDAIKKQTFLCAHNADFDISFLEAAFRRNNIDIDLYYVDTLAIAKENIKGLSNYKLNILANLFNIINKEEHRASSDAEVCGNILVRILQKMYS